MFNFRAVHYVVDRTVSWKTSVGGKQVNRGADVGESEEKKAMGLRSHEGLRSRILTNIRAPKEPSVSLPPSVRHVLDAEPPRGAIQGEVTALDEKADAADRGIMGSAHPIMRPRRWLRQLRQTPGGKNLVKSRPLEAATSFPHSEARPYSFAPSVSIPRKPLPPPSRQGDPSSAAGHERPENAGGEPLPSAEGVRRIGAVPYHWGNASTLVDVSRSGGSDVLPSLLNPNGESSSETITSDGGDRRAATGAGDARPSSAISNSRGPFQEENAVPNTPKSLRSLNVEPLTQGEITEEREESAGQPVGPLVKENIQAQVVGERKRTRARFAETSLFEDPICPENQTFGVITFPDLQPVPKSVRTHVLALKTVLARISQALSFASRPSVSDVDVAKNLTNEQVKLAKMGEQAESVKVSIAELKQDIAALEKHHATLKSNPVPEQSNPVPKQSNAELEKSNAELSKRISKKIWAKERNEWNGRVQDVVSRAYAEYGKLDNNQMSQFPFKRDFFSLREKMQEEVESEFKEIEGTPAFEQRFSSDNWMPSREESNKLDSILRKYRENFDKSLRLAKAGDNSPD